MTEFLNKVYEEVDAQHSDKSAATRRQVVAGAAATFGSMGLLGMASSPAFGQEPSKDPGSPNTAEAILNIAATAEVLATIVNTVGAERVKLDATTLANVQAAARHEVIHYDVLTSAGVGGKELTKKIWVPDAVFSSAENFLKTLIVGDQIFVNAYLLGGTVFARSGGLRGSRFSRFAAEFMAVESVHRALALQSLGRLGNDRTFAKFGQKEEVPGLLTTGVGGFYEITEAVALLQKAGFGFGKQGATAGAFYEFDEVRKRTPDPGGRQHARSFLNPRSSRGLSLRRPPGPAVLVAQRV